MLHFNGIKLRRYTGHFKVLWRLYIISATCDISAATITNAIVNTNAYRSGIDPALEKLIDQNLAQKKYIQSIEKLKKNWKKIQLCFVYQY